MSRRSKYPSLGILDAISRFVLGFSVDPSRQGLYEFLPQSSRPDRIRYSKILYHLGRSGYIKDSRGIIKLTDKGLLKGLHRQLNKLVLRKVRDGKSRLIAFDIPEKMRHARDIMRGKLKDFECIKVQKSLYLTPYVCEGEIDELVRILDIKQYVHVVIIERIIHFPLLQRSSKK